MNNQKLRIARIKRMADKKFGRHKCPNNNQKLRIARIARIFNDKIRRHKCPNCYGFLSAVANLYPSDACVPKFSENNICKIREIRS